VAANAAVDAGFELATTVGDVVAVALATRAAELLTGRTHPAADDCVPLSEGWEHVLASLLAREPVG
jgi:hypothetical protein